MTNYTQVVVRVDLSTGHPSNLWLHIHTLTLLRYEVLTLH